MKRLSAPLAFLFLLSMIAVSGSQNDTATTIRRTNQEYLKGLKTMGLLFLGGGGSKEEVANIDRIAMNSIEFKLKQVGIDVQRVFVIDNSPKLAIPTLCISYFNWGEKGYEIGEAGLIEPLEIPRNKVKVSLMSWKYSFDEPKQSPIGAIYRYTPKKRVKTKGEVIQLIDAIGTEFATDFMAANQKSG